MKPVIGITSHMMAETGPLGHSHVGNTYITSISKAGGIPVIIPVLLNQEQRLRIIELCDGFLFTGGLDISPSYYNEEPHIKLQATNLSMDRTQIPLMQDVIRSQKPVLGICRGHQVLNVACGGSLYQDISEISGTYIKHHQETGNGDVSHQVIIHPDSKLHALFGNKLMVNSYHHQAVKHLGANLVAVAHSLDGVVEAIEIENYPFGLGIQWHPEAMFGIGDDSMKPIFDAFIKAASK